MAVLEIAPDTSRVREASDWMARLAGGFGIPGDALNRLDLCLNEALANIIEHGRPAAAIHLELAVARTRSEAEATLTIVDAGRAFDVSRAERKPLPRSLEDVEPGGLGLVMIRSFADRLSYERVDGRNRLCLGVCWAVAS